MRFEIQSLDLHCLFENRVLAIFVFPNTWPGQKIVIFDTKPESAQNRHF